MQGVCSPGICEGVEICQYLFADWSSPVYLCVLAGSIFTVARSGHNEQAIEDDTDLGTRPGSSEDYGQVVAGAVLLKERRLKQERAQASRAIPQAAKGQVSGLCPRCAGAASSEASTEPQPLQALLQSPSSPKEHLDT